jgi:ParB/RepB/Spo0J family partition protein
MPNRLKGLLWGAGWGGEIVDIEISKIKVRDNETRTRDEPLVQRLVKSIREAGQLNPVYVTKEDDGYLMLSGHHRLGAAGLLGEKTIRGIITEGDPRILELAKIDENLVRRDIGPSEYAWLVQRRDVLFKDLTSQELSQFETPSERVPGSIRDHAEKTGESKDKVHRALKRANELGGDILRKTSRTCLDKDVELDALARRSPPEREKLVARAGRGEVVSARTADGKPRQRKTRGELGLHEGALRALQRWREDHPWVETQSALKSLVDKMVKLLSSYEPERDALGADVKQR